MGSLNKFTDIAISKIKIRIALNGQSARILPPRLGQVVVRAQAKSIT
ncbi:hypothetical protein H1P_2450004 [Hyella patelloides LEGE 07179]|uniref:Uncharacterized protein n=1 Tax=Hyella patelloides LEGE 07179 TaxID=945734 RepID=A0A563VRS4_9CYAN|nr:hypothetical protein H1P_2450004 [Hyella patelloides LEGE 07179]